MAHIEAHVSLSIYPSRVGREKRTLLFYMVSARFVFSLS
jgi:hypothetical protein